MDGLQLGIGGVVVVLVETNLGREIEAKVEDEKRSDAYFSRSDNQTLADNGIPAHTMCVAYDFGDYHGVGDEWQKLDYENMARVDRMVTLGVWMLADTDKVPVWNAKLPDTAPYVAAAAKLHPSAGAAAGEAH